MGYRTENELNHFSFGEAYIDEMRVANGVMKLALENVMIHPENSCNRDIRMMRTNDLVMTIPDAKLISVIKEGYKTYNADGVFQTEYPDITIEENAWTDALKSFEGATIYSITKGEDSYTICIDTEEEGTFDVVVSGKEDIEEWERFLNLA